MGTLKQDGKIEDKTYTLERGVYSFPSIGDTVILPTDIQLKSIVENKEKNSIVKIGVAPIAGNAEVKINPDKLFGRHVAILGNTGSGKSCSVAGIIRWSLEEASKQLPKSKQSEDQKLNTRFIIVDPNGEYTHAFNGLNCDIKKFKVDLTEEEKKAFNELKVPAWLWNSYEWSSFSNASGRTQRPILRKALRELRSGETDGISDFNTKVRCHFSGCYASIKNDLSTTSNYKDDSTKFGKKLLSIIEDINNFKDKCDDEKSKKNFDKQIPSLNNILNVRYKTFPDKNTGKTVEYYSAFSHNDLETIIDSLKSLLDNFGGLIISVGPNEDTPIPFEVSTIPDHVERLSHEAGVIQFVDFLIMRMRSMLSDTRMNKIITNNQEITLDKWLEDTINGISIIDLSLVPSDISHIVVAVISRLLFESIQRYRRSNNHQLLPTVIVMEEAHNFIKRYNESNEEISTSQLCAESFERIAREGRKYGLSLMLSSQRPSELSPTVLSQCNTFLLH